MGGEEGSGAQGGAAQDKAEGDPATDHHTRCDGSGSASRGLGDGGALLCRWRAGRRARRRDAVVLARMLTGILGRPIHLGKVPGRHAQQAGCCRWGGCVLFVSDGQKWWGGEGGGGVMDSLLPCFNPARRCQVPQCSRHLVPCSAVNKRRLACRAVPHPERSRASVACLLPGRTRHQRRRVHIRHLHAAQLVVAAQLVAAAVDPGVDGPLRSRKGSGWMCGCVCGGDRGAPGAQEVKALQSAPHAPCRQAAHPSCPLPSCPSPTPITCKVHASLPLGLQAPANPHPFRTASAAWASHPLPAALGQRR